MIYEDERLHDRKWEETCGYGAVDHGARQRCRRQYLPGLATSLATSVHWNQRYPLPQLIDLQKLL
jgi:hypothetical protein